MTCKDGELSVRYVQALGETWAETRVSGSTSATFWHHTDHEGTSEVITDSTGSIVWEASYEAYGAVIRTNATMSFTPSYTGKEFDSDIGLYYHNARWYDPDLGRFITEDPARDGVNWFAYCNENPIRYIDPTGLEVLPPAVEKVLKERGTDLDAAKKDSASSYDNDIQYQYPIKPIKTECVLECAEPQKKPTTKVDSVYVTPFPKQNGPTTTGNQNKNTKVVWAEATIKEGIGENSCDLAVGMLSMSSELNKTKNPTYAQTQVDVLNLNFSFKANDGGSGITAGGSIFSVSGNIGTRFETPKREIKATLGGSLGLNAGLDVQFDYRKGIVLDAAFIVGARIETSWGEKSEK